MLENQPKKTQEAYLENLNLNDSVITQINEDLQLLVLEKEELKNKGALTEAESVRYTTLKTKILTLENLKKETQEKNATKARQEFTSPNDVWTDDRLNGNHRGSASR